MERSVEELWLSGTAVVTSSPGIVGGGKVEGRNTTLRNDGTGVGISPAIFLAPTRP